MISSQDNQGLSRQETKKFLYKGQTNENVIVFVVSEFITKTTHGKYDYLTTLYCVYNRLYSAPSSLFHEFFKPL
jgi:hypothetical protein